MPTIVSLKLVEHPSATSKGARATVHRSIYEATVDIPMLGDMVCQYAQELVGTLPATNPDGTDIDEVPNPGDRLFWSSDNSIVPDTYSLGVAGVVEFLADGTVTGAKWYDAGSLALDFETTRLPGGCAKDWQIVVTYREPQPGANERPQQLIQLLTGRSGGDATPQEIPFTGAVADSGVERWIEHRPYRIPTGEGYVFNPPILATAKTPMRMPNGEEYPPLQRDAWVDVLVISRNVGDETYAHTLNKAYYNTCNNDVVNLGGRTQPKYTIHYESTRTGRPIQRDNSTYYRAETRLVLHGEPDFVTRQAYGSYYLSAGERVKPLDKDGQPIPNIPLSINGSAALADGSNIHSVQYSTRKPVLYASEFGY